MVKMRFSLPLISECLGILPPLVGHHQCTPNVQTGLRQFRPVLLNLNESEVIVIGVGNGVHNALDLY